LQLVWRAIIVSKSTGAKQMQNRFEARREQMLKELASDLADLVASGDMTDMEANEWYNSKADQWAQEG
jgi:hypothetical protein